MVFTAFRWTEERRALLRERFPTCADDAALLVEINALPGPTIGTIDALRNKAIDLKVKRHPEVVSLMRSRAGAEGRALQAPLRPEGTVWTPERRALLRAKYNTIDDLNDLLAELNELPGDPIKSVRYVRDKAQKLKVTRTRAAQITPARPPIVWAYEPKPVQSPALADAAAATLDERMRAAVKRAMAKGELSWEQTVELASKFRVPPRRIRIVVGQIRLG